MKAQIVLFIAGIASTASAVTAVKPYSQWMADSFIARGVAKEKSYTFPTLYRGFEMVYNATRNTKYSTFVQTQVDAVLTDNATSPLIGWNFGRSHLDDIKIGSSILDLYARTKQAKYKTAADFLRQRLNLHPRTASGGFWHKIPEYPNQMWLDGLFMQSDFYARYTSFFDSSNVTAWNDIVHQFELIEEHTRDPESGLLFHGYDESKVAVWADPVTGACPHIWDRAVGWYAMALLDVLDYLPKSNPGYAKLKGYFTTLAAAIIESQDSATGGWWLVMDEPYPGQAGNYIESSGVSMFTYSMLKGIRKGFLPKSTYEAPARRAYQLMLDKFVTNSGVNNTLNWEGTVEVGSLGGNGTYEYYIAQKIAQNDFKGAGPFIYASIELEKLDA
ncbi:Six-hairpin glycosidase [Pseudovirgaria hyperparasitica]|uniref:Six-hairpin glycosidase n=1 Tax=Pseudovirgaria hyperparasitica TaxID=470096 RepID=A0A6A6WEJ5_9PEZI|nr:Six-hairpin glycosidase [Pseudovirgaria hyperparasitica]KAF2761248.1 Six-hairpin glycosidase [Pseudovirgaria hyperparasitica]